MIKCPIVFKEKKNNKQINNIDVASSPYEDIFYKILQKLLLVYKFGGVVLLIFAFAAVLFNIVPGSWYLIDRGAVEQNKDVLVNSPINVVSASESNGNDAELIPRQGGEQVLSTAAKLPEKNSNLPTTTTLNISKIGVNAVVHGGNDGDAALDLGVWQQSNQGDPGQEGTIVYASHRWGPLSWSREHRNLNSFMRLPELRVGDTFSVYYDQRDFRYRITDVYEVDGSIESSSDMVLYTCKYFRSSERIVVEAERITS